MQQKSDQTQKRESDFLKTPVQRKPFGSINKDPFSTASSNKQPDFVETPKSAPKLLPVRVIGHGAFGK